MLFFTVKFGIFSFFFIVNGKTNLFPILRFLHCAIILLFWTGVKHRVCSGIGNFVTFIQLQELFSGFKEAVRLCYCLFSPLKGWTMQENCNVILYQVLENKVVPV